MEINRTNQTNLQQNVHNTNHRHQRQQQSTLGMLR